MPLLLNVRERHGIHYAPSAVVTTLATSRLTIAPLTDTTQPQDRRELATLLAACVRGGASIGFVLPLAEEEVAAYWAKIFRGVDAGERLLLVARLDGAIVGSAQLAFEARANGRHRAEVQKVMVRPEQRRKGIARALMSEIETAARTRGVRLLFLDTSDSHAGARTFYDTLQYVYVGGIPGYALDPHGVPEPNAIYYKTLEPGI